MAPPIFFTSAAFLDGNKRTGFEAMRLGAVAYIVPFLFVYSPTLLLIGSFTDVLLAVVTAFAGTAVLAVGLVGYLYRHIGWSWRLPLIAAGVGLLIPPRSPIPFSEAMNIVGATIGIVFILLEKLRRRQELTLAQEVSAEPPPP
jgi:TRAP-type uncharacterized transport system fused permease subunit